jgi:hypothetical protein
MSQVGECGIASVGARMSAEDHDGALMTIWWKRRQQERIQWSGLDRRALRTQSARPGKERRSHLSALR